MGKVRAGIVIVLEIVGQNAMQMGFVQCDHMIETLLPYGADHSFAIRILPRRAGYNQDFFNKHRHGTTDPFSWQYQYCVHLPALLAFAV